MNEASLRESPAVQGFLEFYLSFGGELASQVGYVALPQARYDEQLERIQAVAG